MNYLQLREAIRSGTVFWDSKDRRYVLVEHHCPVCDRRVGEGFRLELVRCDGCGSQMCQHLIGTYDDEGGDVERFYCHDCARARRDRGKLCYPQM